MKTRVAVSKCTVRGVPHWRVRWHEAAAVRRKFFTSREAADTHASTVRGEAVGVRQLLTAIPQAAQEKLVMLYKETERRGIDILDLLATTPQIKPSAPSFREVLAELITTKTTAGRNRRYVKRLGQILAHFAKGREAMPINHFTHIHAEQFIETKKPAYRAANRTILSTLFKFAVRRGYRADNPCDRLETQITPKSTPEILTVEEVTQCRDWLTNNPRIMAWFALSTFAGLRPEEAAKISWNEINFEEGWIRVAAHITKTRQRRVVYPLPTALHWLRAAKNRKALLPLSLTTKRKYTNKLRAILGWPKWKKDCTRHSAASYWLAHCGSTATVSTALGHTEGILRKHYMALVTKKQAEEFYNIAPEPPTPPTP